MKKLVTTIVGGAPLTLDFLGFMDAKMSDIMTGLSSVSNQYILSGCTLTQGVSNWQITAGWMVLDGEIFKVIGGDTGIANATALSDMYWQINQTAVSPSPDVYENLAPEDDTLERTASLTTVPVGFVPTYADTPSYSAMLGDLLTGSWNIVGGAGQPAFQNSWASSDTPLRFSLDAMGRLSLSGSAFLATPYTAAVQSVIFTLPVGFRPAVRKVMTVFFGGSYLATVTIGTDGTVTFASAQGNATVLFYMDGIPPFYLN
jgi:hypothetical protein